MQSGMVHHITVSEHVVSYRVYKQLVITNTKKMHETAVPIQRQFPA